MLGFKKPNQIDATLQLYVENQRKPEKTREDRRRSEKIGEARNGCERIGEVASE